MEKYEKPSLGQLLVLQPGTTARRARAVHAGVIVQLLSIRDNHPQWRKLNREDRVIASHAYGRLRNLNAPGGKISE